MALCYVLDEQLRGPLWRALIRHNTSGVDPVDVTRVGDPADLPQGTLDPEVLLWASQHGRVLVTRDWNTIPGHLTDFLQQGYHSPGVLIIRDGFTLRELIDWLVLVAHASDPADYLDQFRFIPP